MLLCVGLLERIFGRYFCRQRHFLTGASAVRSHREQQQRARLRQPRLRLQAGRFFPEEEKLGLRKPAETPQLQLPEVSKDISESSNPLCPPPIFDPIVSFDANRGG